MDKRIVAAAVIAGSAVAASLAQASRGTKTVNKLAGYAKKITGIVSPIDGQPTGQPPAGLGPEPSGA